MAHTLLGKTAPKSTIPSSPPKTGYAFSIAAILLVMTGSSYLFVTSQAPVYNQPSTSTNSEVRTLGVATVHASSTTPTDPCGDATKSPGIVFPLVPDALLPKGACPPTQWNLTVIRYFAEKSLVFLNWFAAAVAILLTVWAGLLYMAGFLNEANTKTAKTVLTNTYIGLIIVMLARLIVFGRIQSITAPTYDSGSVPAGTTNFITASPKSK